MPMTMKSCFYPLIGNKIYSWPGDLVDILSVITTLFGVCTSLGLGVIQITAGLNFISESVGDTTKNQVGDTRAACLVTISSITENAVCTY